MLTNLNPGFPGSSASSHHDSSATFLHPAFNIHSFVPAATNYVYLESMVQVIVMVMTHDNGVQVRQFVVVDLTGRGTRSFWPHELHGGTPVAKYRVRQDGNFVHLNQHTCTFV